MKAAVRVLLLCALSLLLVACDPWGPSNPGTADLTIHLTPEGGADAHLILPAQRSGLSLPELGSQVATDLFPNGPRPHTSIDSQGGAFPVIRISASSVYSPGSRPELRLDLGDAVSTLHAHGLTFVNVSVEAPFVPSGARWSPRPTYSDARGWSWRGLTVKQLPPSGHVELHPEPLRAVGELGLLLVAMVALTIGVRSARRRKRWPCVACGAIAVLACGAVMLTAGAAQGDNLGVAGLLSGTPLKVVTLLPLVGLGAIPLGFALVALGFSYGKPAFAGGSVR